MQVTPCSVAILKHTITQSRAIIRHREKWRERGRQRAGPILMNIILNGGVLLPEL